MKPHLKEDPFDVRAIRMLAELAARIGGSRIQRIASPSDGDRADFMPARANLAMVLGRLGRPAEALELLDGLFEAEPEAVGISISRLRHSGAWASSKKRCSCTKPCSSAPRTSRAC